MKSTKAAYVRVTSRTYRKRPIRFQGILQIGDWQVKTYTLSSRKDAPNPGVVDVAIRTAHQWLPKPAIDTDRYGIAILIVHESTQGNYIYISWWTQEYLLKHYVFFSTHDRPGKLEYYSPSGIIASIWELEIFCFERKAWLDKVLMKPSRPDMEGYLQAHFEGEI
jgi:hypothetical protein